LSAASVTLLCPACGQRLQATDVAPRCPCGAALELRPETGFEQGGPLTGCAACGSEAMYIAKDFNKNVGVAIVALGCLGFFWGALVGISTLVGLTIVDRVVYHLRPLVTVCYACKSVYRDVELNPIHRPYELTYDETFEGTGSPPDWRRESGDDAQSPL